MKCKPRVFKIQKFSAIIQELNNILPQFLGPEESNKTPKEELNKILLHTILHGWSKQAMVIRFDFKSDPFCADTELFKRMEVAESIYEGAGAPYQNKYTRTYFNRFSAHKTQGGDPALPTGYTNNRARKHKNKYAEFSKSNNIDTPSCMIHCVDQSSEECKFLQSHWAKYKHHEYSLGGKPAIDKRIKFNKNEEKGKDLNTTVKRAVMDALKGNKNKCTHKVASDINVSTDADEASGIDCIKLADLEWNSE